MISSIQAQQKTLRNATIGIASIASLLIGCVLASSYVWNEIHVRDEKIGKLNTQISMLQTCQRDGASQIANLTQMVRSLNNTVDALRTENNRLASLPQAKQYELKLAWHEISVLRNQTERLKNQIIELERQLDVLEASPFPAD